MGPLLAHVTTGACWKYFQAEVLRAQALDRGSKALGMSKDLKEGVLFM